MVLELQPGPESSTPAVLQHVSCHLLTAAGHSLTAAGHSLTAAACYPLATACLALVAAQAFEPFLVASQSTGP